MKIFFLVILVILVSLLSCKQKAKEQYEGSIAVFVDSTNFTSKDSAFKETVKNKEEVRYIRITDSAASLLAVSHYRKYGKTIRSISQGFFYIDSILTIDTVSRKEFYSISKDKSITK